MRNGVAGAYHGGGEMESCPPPEPGMELVLRKQVFTHSQAHPHAAPLFPEPWSLHLCSGAGGLRDH